MKHRMAEMKEIGLQTSTTGDAGGEETGQSLTQYVLLDGRSEPAASNSKYTCPNCGTNAWAKPQTKLICGACYKEDDGEITFLEPEANTGEQEAA